MFEYWCNEGGEVGHDSGLVASSSSSSSRMSGLEYRSLTPQPCSNPCFTFTYISFLKIESEHPEPDLAVIQCERYNQIF